MPADAGPTRTVRPFAKQDGYTVFNNYVLDHIMPRLKPTTWKTLCFILRNTVGWDRESDELSYSQIMKGTGIHSSATVSSALRELVDLRYIVSEEQGEWEANRYRLNIDFEMRVPSTSKNEVASKSEAVPTSKNEVVPTSKFEDTEIKGKKRKEKSVAQAPAPAPDKPHDHPAVVMHREWIAAEYEKRQQLWPTKSQKRLIAETVTDLERWRHALAAWSKAGHLSKNVEGQLEWYRQGAPPARASPQGRGSQSDGTFIPGVGKVR